MKIYYNGYMINDSTGKLQGIPQPPLAYFRIGGRELPNAGQFWVGRIDDFRVYTRELSASEIATIGTKGTGLYSRPIDTLANLDPNSSDTKQRIDFRDFAKMANNWLKQTVWP
jgi:hypothetical protein